MFGIQLPSLVKILCNLILEKPNYSLFYTVVLCILIVSFCQHHLLFISCFGHLSGLFFSPNS